MSEAPGAPKDAGLLVTPERTRVLEGSGARWWSEIPADLENRCDRFSQRQ